MRATSSRTKKRLDDVVVGAQFQADDAVSLRRTGCQEDDWNVSKFRVAANPLADIQSVGVREHDVEDHQIRAFLAAKVYCTLPCLCAYHLETLFFEVVFEKSEKVGIVFNEQDFFHSRNTFTTDRPKIVTKQLRIHEL